LSSTNFKMKKNILGEKRASFGENWWSHLQKREHKKENWKFCTKSKKIDFFSCILFQCLV